MALVKSIVTGPRKNDLKLVVMSATLDVERLRSYFQSDCLVKLEGRTFPIEIYNTMEAQSDYIVSYPEIALTKAIITLLFSIELNGAMCNLDCAFRTRMGRHLSLFARTGRNRRNTKSSNRQTWVFEAKMPCFASFRQLTSIRAIQSFLERSSWFQKNRAVNKYC